MKYNEQIKNLLDDVIADITNNKTSFVKNPEKDFTRDRKLPFDKVIKIVLSMKGNTLNKELYDFFGRTPEEIVTTSAFIQQRDKLADNVFEEIFHRFNQSMTKMKTFNNYRVFAVDGSDINIAYNTDSDTYIKPQRTKNNELTKGFNQYHLNAIYDIVNNVYINAKLQPRPQLNERREFLDMLDNMQLAEKSIFIADREYPSWNLFAHFKYKHNAEYVVRVRDSENLIVRNLPMIELDIDRETIASTERYAVKDKRYSYISPQRREKREWDYYNDELLKFRIVRFKISENTYETIFTSLPREKFSLQDIKELYRMRWGIETSFRELKYVIGLINMHCKKEEFAKQEIFAKLIMYNFCERIISVAVIKQDAGKKHKYQINYTMGMQICLDFYRSLVNSDDVYILILKYTEAIREGRQDKRKLRAKYFISFTYRVAA